MQSLLWTTLACVFCVCRCSPVERQAMSYVVERGCMYLSHYVRENYYDYEVFRRQAATGSSSSTVAMTTSSPSSAVAMTTSSPSSTTTHINWVSYVYEQMRADYVPMELFKGLMNCGKEYAFFAINAPDDIKNALHINYEDVPGLVG